MAEENKEWFKTWFDNKYYHLLYNNRDEAEAEVFIENLLNVLNPKPNDTFLDLACGKGRHSIFLNSKGYNVCGLDLSNESITFAKKHESDTLQFKQGDFRESFGVNEYDYIFNLFTSFGYVGHKDSVNVLNNMKVALIEKGTLVIDFLNVEYVKSKIVSRETLVKEGVTFEITRVIIDNVITKNIEVKDKNFTLSFREEVNAYSVNDFLNMFEEVGLTCTAIYGSYKLDTFSNEHSDRLIMTITKK